MSEFCPSCGEVRAEQRSAWHDFEWYELGLTADPNGYTVPDYVPPGLRVFCELCLHEISQSRKVKLLDPDTPEERYPQITDIEIDRYLARKLAELAARVAHKLPIQRCQSIISKHERHFRCNRLAARLFNGLWLCGHHCLPKFQPAIPYRHDRLERVAYAFVVSGDPEDICRQLHACLPPNEIAELARRLSDPQKPMRSIASTSLAQSAS